MPGSSAHEQAPRNVVGLGQCSIDRVCRVEVMPRAGQKAPASVRELTGGQVMTALLALRRLGFGACFCGAVGDDADGERVAATLRAAGIDTQLAIVPGARTRAATVIVDNAGERTILEHEDPRVRPTVLQLVDAVGLKEAQALHLDLSFPQLALAAARRAKAAGLLVSVDADTLVEGAAEGLFPLVDQLVVSAEVPRLLGAESLTAGLLALRRHCPGLVCITLGERGSVALDAAGEQHEVAAFAVDVKDTTGCGDVFRAALLAATLEGRAVAEALRFASAAAALAATGEGAQGCLPTWSEVEALLV